MLFNCCFYDVIGHGPQALMVNSISDFIASDSCFLQVIFKAGLNLHLAITSVEEGYNVFIVG